MTKVVDINSIKDNDFYFKKAELHYLSGEYFTSLRYLHRCAAESDEPGRYTTIIGQIFTDLGCLDAAKKAFKASILADPGDYAAELGIAIVLRMERNWDAANFYAHKAMQNSSHRGVFKEIYRSLLAGAFGKDLEDVQDERLAARTMFSLASENLDDEEEYFEYIDALIAQNRYKKAQREIAKLLNSNPDTRFRQHLMKAKAMCAFGLKDFAETKRLNDQIYAEYGNQIDWLQFHLSVDSFIGDSEDLMEKFKILTAMERPENDFDFFKLITVLISYGFDGRVIELLKGVDFDKNRVGYQFYRALGIAHYNTGDNKKAIFIMRNLYEIFGEYKDAFYFLKYFKNNSADVSGKLQLTEEFEIPEALALDYLNHVERLLNADDAVFLTSFEKDAEFREALDWVFESDLENIASLVLSKMSMQPSVSYIPFLERKLFLSEYEDFFIMIQAFRIILDADPERKIFFLKDECFYTFALPFYEEIQSLPEVFRVAYQDFAIAAAINEPGSEERALDACKQLVDAAKEAGIERFKSAGALSVLMFYYLETPEPIIKGAVLGMCNIFRTNLQTVNRYAKALGF